VFTSKVLLNGSLLIGQLRLESAETSSRSDDRARENAGNNLFGDLAVAGEELGCAHRSDVGARGGIIGREDCTIGLNEYVTVHRDLRTLSGLQERAIAGRVEMEEASSILFEGSVASAILVDKILNGLLGVSAVQ